MSNNELKLDMDVVNHILDLLIAYWRPGKLGGPSGWLIISGELDDEETQHPGEYARAKRIYCERYMPRKERQNRRPFHASAK